MVGRPHWLLLICMGISLYIPIITLRSLAVTYDAMPQFFEDYAGLLVVPFTVLFVCLGMLAFSTYIGVGLWRMRPGADRRAKRYIAFLLIIYATAAILFPMANGIVDF